MTNHHPIGRGLRTSGIVQARVFWLHDLYEVKPPGLRNGKGPTHSEERKKNNPTCQISSNSQTDV